VKKNQLNRLKFLKNQPVRFGFGFISLKQKKKEPNRTKSKPKKQKKPEPNRQKTEPNQKTEQN